MIGRYLTAFAASLFTAAMSSAAATENDPGPSPAQAAESYRKLFQRAENLEEKLGESYFPLLFPGEAEDRPPSDAEKELFNREVRAIVAEAGNLGTVSEVDWGLKERLARDGFATEMDHLSGARQILLLASSFARTEFSSDPDAALEALSAGLNLGRFVHQEPTLLSHLTHIACEGIVFAGIAELAPGMTDEQLARVRKAIDNAPATGRLADSLRTEKAIVVGHHRARLEQVWKEWREKYRSTDFRFPEDFRLAGIVRQPGKRIRVCLHFAPTGEVFWLEEGKEYLGVRLEKVVAEENRAHLRFGRQSAILDLAEQTIEDRHVPWTVIQT